MAAALFLFDDENMDSPVRRLNSGVALIGLHCDGEQNMKSITQGIGPI